MAYILYKNEYSKNQLLITENLIKELQKETTQHWHTLNYSLQSNLLCDEVTLICWKLVHTSEEPTGLELLAQKVGKDQAHQP